MSNIKWFDRKFQFNHTASDYPAIYTRLSATPGVLRQMLAHLPENALDKQPEGKWSVKEHVGHLSVLEPLWRARIADIQHAKAQLTIADLENKATFEAGFNRYPVQQLIDDFTRERTATLHQLAGLQPDKIISRSLHPRMQQELSLTDHLYFVAEHDDHHIEYIRTLLA